MNKPALQTALILLRSTAASRVGHLARILAPSVIDSFARDIDDAVTQGFLALADLPQLNTAQHTAVGLPLRQGGLGFRRLEWTAEAAYVGACLQSAHYLQAGFGTHPALATSRVSGGFQDVCVRLHGKYGFLVLDSLGLNPEDVARQPRKKVQKTLADRAHKHLSDEWGDSPRRFPRCRRLHHDGRRSQRG